MDSQNDSVQVSHSAPKEQELTLAHTQKKREEKKAKVTSCLRSHFRSVWLGSKGAVIVLIWSGLVHVFFYRVFLIQILTRVYINMGEQETLLLFIIAVATAALTHLFYPVAGLMGELLWTRYKVIICGNCIMLCGLVLYIAVATLTIIRPDLPPPFGNVSSINSTELFEDSADGKALGVMILISYFVFQSGLGFFEANAIQFGLDQLQFASSTALSVFVHWYNWTTISIAYILGLVICLAQSSPFTFTPFAVFTVLPGLQFICCIASLVMVIAARKSLVTELDTHKNPLKLIYGVLNFARTHKKALFRSAFTYGEGAPSRLDLAKKRYGGPFTTEEVEDVKSFWRIILVLLSLGGYQFMASTGHLFVEYERLYGLLPGNIPCLLYDADLSFIPVVLGLPIYQLFLRPYLHAYVPSMLKRIGLGLSLFIFALACEAVFSILMYIESTTRPGSCSHQSYQVVSSGEAQDVKPPFSIYLIIIPQLLIGVGYYLVPFIALEFIVAQAPRSMQSLLIGLWYSLQSIQITFQAIPTFTLFPTACASWPYFVRIVASVFLLIVYVCVAYYYKPRQRVEYSNINMNVIIQDYSERQVSRQLYNNNVTLIHTQGSQDIAGSIN